MINVLHVIGGGLSNGAAKGATILHDEMSEMEEVQSQIFNNSLTEKIEVNKARFFIINYLIDKLKSRLLSFVFKPSAFYSTDLFGARIPRKILKQIDILHIHTFSNSIININDLLNIDVPVVITLRDMWMLTGGCHYSLACSGFQRGCQSCPLSGNNKFGVLTSGQFNKKRNLLNTKNNIFLVGISKWIIEQAKQSLVTNGSQIKYVPNQIDVKTFRPIPITNCMEVIGFNNNSKTILTGGVNLSNPYKGLSHLLSALSQLSESYNVIFFGKELNLESICGKHNVIQIGKISDTNRLVELYNIADVFLCSSIQEAFGKTMVESIACGTPVVAFKDSGGADDIVVHNKNGYLAKKNSIEDFANGIQTVLSKKWSRLIVRGTVEEKFSAQKSAKEYVKLYKELMK